MNDRELLELAAKASGLTGYIHEWINGPEFVIPGTDPVTWRPLTDDGDALRLAVKLDIDFYMGADSEGPEAWAGYYLPGKENKKHACVSIGADPYAATRRAIVRAAAEIGKAMK